MEDKKKAFLAIQLSSLLKRRATIAAAKQGVSRSELVRRAIEEYVDKVEVEEKET